MMEKKQGTGGGTLSGHSEYNERYMWLSLFVVIIGTFMAILDTSIVNIAIPKMMTVFGASTSEIQWVVTGYLLTMGIVIPLTGYLGDTYGYKRMYIFALSVFTLGSALSSLAWSTETMIGARVIQAIGGGMIMPVGMSMIYKTVPIEKRGMALGVWGISSMAAPAIGPTLSGYIIEYLNWRLIFAINIPVGIFGVTMATLILKETPRNKDLKFDLWGAVTVAIGLFTLLLGLSKVNTYGWSSLFVMGLLITSAISLTAFTIIELRSPDPLLELRVLKSFPYSLSLVISSVTTIVLFGGLFLLPLYLESLRGYSAMQTGLLMFPSAIATGIMMPVSGRLFDRFGAKWLTISGLSIVAISTFLMSRLSMDSSYNYVMIVYLIRGIGIGMAMMPTQTAGMNSIPIELAGRASALNNTIKQVMGSLGIAILTSILASRQVFHAARYSEAINVNSPAYSQLQGQLQGTFVEHGMNAAAAKMGTVSQLYGQVMQQAMVSALDDTFLIAGFIALIGIPLAFFIKKGHSGDGQPRRKGPMME